MPYRLVAVILALTAFTYFVLGSVPDPVEPSTSTPTPVHAAGFRTARARATDPVRTPHGPSTMLDRSADVAAPSADPVPENEGVEVRFVGYRPSEPLVLAWEDVEGNPKRIWSDLQARMLLHDVPAQAGRLVLRHRSPHDALRFDHQALDGDPGTKRSAELHWPAPIEARLGGLDLTVVLHEEAAELLTRVELSIAVVPHGDTEAQRRREGEDRAIPLSQFSMLGSGHFWTRLSGLEPGSYRVFVERLGFAVDVAVEPGRTSEAELVCGPLAHVLVQVVDATGSVAVPDSFLARAWPAGFEPLQSGRLWRRTRHEELEGGMYELVCAPGRLLVDLSRHGAVDRRIEEVTAGWNDLRLECARSYGVSLELPRSMSLAQIERLAIRAPEGARILSRGLGRRMSTQSGLASEPLLRFTVSHPGLYVVNAGPPEDDRAWTVEVSAAGAVLVRAQPD